MRALPGSLSQASGVVLIGVAQERTSAWSATKQRHGRFVDFVYFRKSVCPNHYYIYVLDPEWGPAFIKICAYAPYPIKICLNGHEWAKRQLQRRRIGFTALDNGFLTCTRPDALQQVCDARWMPRRSSGSLHAGSSRSPSR